MSKVLIVDDEEDLVFGIARRLTAEGFEVICATDGVEGLRMAQTTQPDIILLDVMLPKMDGFKVCRLLKFDQRFRRTPILMLSARSQQEDLATARETGADAYLIKPIDSGTLLQKIRELLDAAVEKT